MKTETSPRIKNRLFVVYLSTGELREVAAPSLRRAVRQTEKEIGAAEIVAAIARECLPQPAEEGMPFHAVLLKNPTFVPPDAL